MKNIIENKKFKTLFPYFLFALSVMIAYKIINELGFVIGWLIRIGSSLTPFVYGFIIAFILSIPTNSLQNLFMKSKHEFLMSKKTPISIVIVYTVFCLLVFFSLNLILPRIYWSISFFVANYQNYYTRALAFLDSLKDFEYFDLSTPINNLLIAFQDFFSGFTPDSITASFTALFSVSSAIFKTFLTLISSVYILLEKDSIKAFLTRLLKALVSEETYTFIIKHLTQVNKNFKRYVFAQTIDGFILGAIVTMELLMLGSPYYLILGIFLGIINYIPYFGSIIGTIIAIVVVAFTQGLSVACVAAVILLITQQIDGNVIQPKLLGGSFAISPFLVIISVTVGGAIAGVFGMIAAIPIVAVLKDILDYGLEHLKSNEDTSTQEHLSDAEKANKFKKP